MVTRREFLQHLLAVAIVTATSAVAQTPSLPRVILITTGTEAFARPAVESFRQGMRDHGYKEDGNYRLETRYGQGDPTLTPPLIKEAVRSRPAVLVVTGLANALHARNATKTIPVVVATSSDLVDAGVVKSYARPGGNITGLNDLADELAVKRFELLKEAMSKATRVTLLVDPEFPATPKIERSVRAAASKLGVEIRRLDAKDPASLAAALDSLAASRPDALLLGGASLLTIRAKEIVERMIAARVPVVHYWPGTAEMGALFSHQADILYNFRRAAFYVDRILKGAKPEDLAIEQPTRYELVVNKKIAGELNISLPSSFLARADKVIE